MPTNILDLPSYTVMGPEADRKNSRSEGMVFSLAPLAGDLGDGLLRPVTANAANILKH